MADIVEYAIFNATYDSSLDEYTLSTGGQNETGKVVFDLDISTNFTMGYIFKIISNGSNKSGYFDVAILNDMKQLTFLILYDEDGATFKIHLDSTEIYTKDITDTALFDFNKLITVNIIYINKIIIPIINDIPINGTDKISLGDLNANFQGARLEVVGQNDNNSIIKMYDIFFNPLIAMPDETIFFNKVHFYTSNVSGLLCDSIDDMFLYPCDQYSSSNMYFSGNVGIGGYGESSYVKNPLYNLHVGGNAYIETLTTGNLTANNFRELPVGSVIAFHGSVIPNDFLLCDGSSVLQTNYPELATVFGVGLGGTIVLPDLRHRFILGKPSSSNLGQINGKYSQTLTIANLPDHQHTGETSINGNHNHTTNQQVLRVGGGGNRQNVGAGGSDTYTTVTTDNAGNHTHTFTTSSTTNANSQPFEIMPPHMALNYIIKARSYTNSNPSPNFEYTTIVWNSHRNRIINGDFRLDQRQLTKIGQSATAFQVYSGGKKKNYPADRWRIYQNIGASTNSFYVNRVNDSPNGVNDDFFTQCLKLSSGVTTGTTATTDLVFLDTIIEGTLLNNIPMGVANNNKKLQLSFWVKSSLTGNYGLSFTNYNKTTTYTTTYNIPTANTWTKITKEIPVPTDGTWRTDTDIGLRIIWDLASGSSYETTTTESWATTSDLKLRTSGSVKVMNNATTDFYITGVQLEMNNYVTPFEVRPYHQELELAQRYYWRIGDADKTYNTTLAHFIVEYTAVSQTQGTCYITLPVLMRIEEPLVAISTYNIYTSDTYGQTWNNLYSGFLPVVALSAPNAFRMRINQVDYYVKKFAIHSQKLMGQVFDLRVFTDTQSSVNYNGQLTSTQGWIALDAEYQDFI